MFPTYLSIDCHAGLRERLINIAGGRLLRYPRDAGGQAWPKLIDVDEVALLRRRVDAGEFDQIGPQAWVNIADPAWPAELSAAAD